MPTIKQVENAIRLARKHVHEGIMNSSVRHCLEEAIIAQNDELYEMANAWALRSLSYSVGVCHPDYRDAFNGEGKC